MTVFTAVLKQGTITVVKDDGDLSNFYNTVILKKEYLHNNETQYRIYQSKENSQFHFFVLTTKKEFFVKKGQPEKWETHVSGWLGMNFKDIERVLSHSCYEDTGVIDIPCLEISAKKDSVTLVTRYKSPSEGWYPLAIIQNFACLYTKEEIKKSSELFSKIALNKENLKTFLNLYSRAYGKLLNATGYFFSDVSPNNVLVKEDMSAIRIIDVLSVCRYNTSSPSALNYSKLIMGKLHRLDPPPALCKLVIDENTGEKYFDPENLTKLRMNIKNIFEGESDDCDYKVLDYKALWSSLPECWKDLNT